MEPWIGNLKHICDHATHFDSGSTIRAAHVEEPRGVSIPEVEGDFGGGLCICWRNTLVVKKRHFLTLLESLEDPRNRVRLRRQPVPPEDAREPKDDRVRMRSTNHPFTEEFH